MLSLFLPDSLGKIIAKHNRMYPGLTPPKIMVFPYFEWTYYSYSCGRAGGSSGHALMNKGKCIVIAYGKGMEAAITSDIEKHKDYKVAMQSFLEPFGTVVRASKDTHHSQKMVVYVFSPKETAFDSLIPGIELSHS